MYLLDVNCLVALGWPNHVHHDTMRRWFSTRGSVDWATSGVVQAGFIRVSMNTRITGTDITFPQARNLLAQLLFIGTHTFLTELPTPNEWPDWLAIRVQGYRQITDALLLACADANEAALATLDGRTADLVDSDHRNLVHTISL